MLAKMRGVSLLPLLLLAGCATRHAAAAPASVAPPAVVHGSRADVTTRPGPADGYVVDDRCRDADCFAVRGDGDHWFEGDRPLVGFDDAATRERWRKLILDAIARPSVNTSGFGGACRDGGLFVTLDDWRDLDGAIARTGALLAREHLRNEVALCIGAATQAVEVHK